MTIRAGVAKNQAAQQEVSSGQMNEASSEFIAAPHHSCYRLSSTSCQNSSNIIKVMFLNHPETHTHPNQSVEKSPSMKQVPGAKNVGNCCVREFDLGQEDALEEGMANCSSIPKNAMDRGAWRATVYGVTESWT